MHRITDVWNGGDWRDAENLSALLGLDLTITRVSVSTGFYGKYVVFTAVDKSGKEHKVVSGSRYVVAALEKALLSDKLPLEAKFVQAGRGIQPV